MTFYSFKHCRDLSKFAGWSDVSLNLVVSTSLLSIEIASSVQITNLTVRNVSEETKSKATENSRLSEFPSLLPSESSSTHNPGPEILGIISSIFSQIGQDFSLMIKHHLQSL